MISIIIYPFFLLTALLTASPLCLHSPASPFPSSLSSISSKDPSFRPQTYEMDNFHHICHFVLLPIKIPFMNLPTEIVFILPSPSMTTESLRRSPLLCLFKYELGGPCKTKLPSAIEATVRVWTPRSCQVVELLLSASVKIPGWWSQSRLAPKPPRNPKPAWRGSVRGSSLSTLKPPSPLDFAFAILVKSVFYHHSMQH